jgi:uncharacterized protein (DUF885 family)
MSSYTRWIALYPLLKWAAAGALVMALAGPAFSQISADSDQQLAADFWAWRAQTAEYTSDDVPRIERPNGVHRDWSAGGLAKQREALAEFDKRWQQLDASKLPIPQQVDHRLIGSALARVHWELDVLKRWQRDPNFYIEQTLTAVAEALTVPAPYNQAQSGEILARLEEIPAIVAQGKQNLASPPAPFAQIAICSLDGIRARLEAAIAALAPQTTVPQAKWQAASDRASTALEQYRAWLEEKLPGLPQQSAIGRDGYLWFLRNVALIPYAPEELVAQAEQEVHRSVAFEELESNRNRTVAPLAMAATLDEFVVRNRTREAEVREFLEQRQILTLPKWLQHYELRPLPPYLAPLADFVETDDFTGPSRLDQPGIRYVVPPSASGGYFWVGDAKDPRVSIVHEGTVGHYGQLCASWRHPDPIRRHYYDSGANEGLGFYAEEMMLQSGLYDDSPHSREIVYNQMRLRALRVIVDVKMALGDFTVAQAAEYLEKNVPMSAAGALQEAVETVELPGQKISYQTGKLQIVQLLEEARQAQGEKFNLRSFHDFIWLNGNVPIALQRWEYLGLDDEMRKLGADH